MRTFGKGLVVEEAIVLAKVELDRVEQIQCMVQGGQASNVWNTIGSKAVPFEGVNFVEMLGWSAGRFQAQLVGE